MRTCLHRRQQARVLGDHPKTNSAEWLHLCYCPALLTAPGSKSG